MGNGIHAAGRPQGTQANKAEGPGGADSTGLSALGAAGTVDATAHLIVVLVVSGIGAVTLLTAGCVLLQGLLRRMCSLWDAG